MVQATLPQQALITVQIYAVRLFFDVISCEVKVVFVNKTDFTNNILNNTLNLLRSARIPHTQKNHQLLTA